jgi:micrococcal nuclease
MTGIPLRLKATTLSSRFALWVLIRLRLLKARGNQGSHTQRAKKYLAAMVLNKVVDVKGYGLGPYNRILGVITTLEGRNVNLEMVKAGLAEVYRGRVPHKFPLLPYWQAEKEAKDDKKGMWSLGDEYISPKAWRKRKK